MSHLHITRARILALATVGVVSTLALAGCAGRDSGTAPEDTGVAEACDAGFTDDAVLIGNSVALSGPAAAYGAIGTTLKLYFDDINAAGGLTFADGTQRDVEVTVLDDGYDPAKAATNIRQLVE